MATSLKLWAIDRIGDAVRMGGEVITNPEHIAARRAICESCEYKGIVTPLPLLKAPGCTKCGCPFRTKCKTLRHFHAKTQKIIETTCPMGKWKTTDKSFKDELS